MTPYNKHTKKKILVIDDDIIITMLLHHFLSKEFDLVCFTKSVEGLDWLSTNTPDLVICDILLPDIDGFEVLKLIRKYRFTFPVIMLSAKQESSERIMCYKLGAQDYLTKPFNPEELELVINKNLSPTILIEQWNKLNKSKSYKEEQKIYDTITKMPISKRLFDIFVSLFGLIVLSPILILTTIAIRLESKGKVYYTSTRIGRKSFKFYKFRSMYVGSEYQLKKLSETDNQYNTETKKIEIDFNSECPACKLLKQTGHKCSPVVYIGNEKICEFWYQQQKQKIDSNKSSFIKILNDPRVTKVGKFIRNTSIDELPQLFNVLKGDMSIVGNRPLPVYEAEKLTKDVMAKRFLAPAGITGLWQVELRGKGGKMSEEERMLLDNEYADHFIKGKWSFWYDMKLILKTIPALFQKGSV